MTLLIKLVVFAAAFVREETIHLGVILLCGISYYHLIRRLFQSWGK